MASPGDLASSAADTLRRQHLQQVADGERVVNTDARDTSAKARSLLFAKIEYHWRDEDKLILEQVKAGARSAFETEFAEVIRVLDRVYQSVYVPQINEYGVVEMDDRGRVLWRLDPQGKPLEDWSLLTGQDIDAALFDLQRLQFGLSQRVSGLLAEALYARHLFDDVYYEAYSAVIDGTVKDREARASRESRGDKYFGFFRFVLWTQADVFQKEVVKFVQLLENVRRWRTYDQRD